MATKAWALVHGGMQDRRKQRRCATQPAALQAPQRANQAAPSYAFWLVAAAHVTASATRYRLHILSQQLLLRCLSAGCAHPAFIRI